MKKLLTLLLAASAMVACKQPANTDAQRYETAPMAMAAPSTEKPMSGDATADANVQANAAVQPISKKIIKEGEIRFETTDLKKARTSLTDTLQRLGGYVDEENEENNTASEQKEYTLKVRIPSQNFERFLNTVSASADHIESKSIRIKDVTTEFIDVTTRLNNKKLLEGRYKALLAKAGKMADILEVESKLNDIRTDIEATQGQLNYLNKQIAYSSLTITFFTRSSLAKNEGDGFGYKLKLALINSWALLQSIFFGLITAWPLILLAVIVLVITRRWLRKRKTKLP